jgi:ubiquinone/menaquinone biosynthesis C-methylase UbiE
MNHTFPLPTESDLNDFYQGFLFNLPDGASASNMEESLRSNVRRMIDILKNRHCLQSGCRILDLGGGVGITASEFARLGFEVVLSDLDGKACAYAEDRFGHEMKVVQGDGSDMEDNSFDFIYSSQVIEHLRDPGSYLNCIHRKLRNQGMVVITTPNQRTCEYLFRLPWFHYYFSKASALPLPSRVCALWKQRWLNFDPPRHLLGFNILSLSKMAENAGFSTLECFPEFGHRSVYNIRRKLPKMRARWRPVFTSIIENLGLFLASRFSLGLAEGNNLVYIGRKKSHFEKTSPND